MPNTIKWVSAAIAIVAIIAGFSSFFGNEKSAEVSLFTSQFGKSYTVEEVNLAVSGAGGEEIDFSSQSEVYRLKLSADAPFTLRYLTFKVAYQGLQETPLSHASTWKLYLSNDYSQQLGVGESLEDGLLHMRFSTPRTQVFLGEKGETELVLVTSVIRDTGNKNEPQIEVSMPASDLPKDMDWKWAPGHYKGSWLTVENSFGADRVGGLPTSSRLQK